MIRYTVELAALEARVDAVQKTWRKRAADRKAELAAAKAYSAGGPSWSDVKRVFMELQGEKCIFCERKLESVELGLIEQDVEHFRPKSNVSAWTPPPELSPKPTITPVPANATGYYLLPHELFNYAASCKPCNSTCKRDFFPIAGAYSFDSADPVAAKKEKPYLVYPIGTWDDDPEALIGFVGTMPVPKKKSGHGRQRAAVTIAFFKLGDPAMRSNLFLERAMLITALYRRLRDADDVRFTAAERKEAADEVEGVRTSPTMAHANCARSFIALYRADPDEARRQYEAALAYRRSKS